MADDVPLQTLIGLRNKTLDEAKRILEPYKLDSETMEKYLATAKSSEPRQVLTIPASVANFDPDRKFWMAVAHLLGASFRQLGKFHSVTPQTVISYVDKVLPVETRAAMRLQTKLSHEAVSEYHVSFIANRGHLRTCTPREAAEWLLANTQRDV